jgi:hypothetical protein
LRSSRFCGPAIDAGNERWQIRIFVIANTVVYWRAYYLENRRPEYVRESNLSVFEIVALNLMTILFTATQFGWLLETAKGCGTSDA